MMWRWVPLLVVGLLMLLIGRHWWAAGLFAAICTIGLMVEDRNQE